MRMSEFEQSKNNNNERHDSLLPINRPGVPDDFTEEDLLFAAELHALFSPEEEKLPPYYVQTLLDSDDQRLEPVTRGFEYKTNAQVFRQLKLRRRLFGSHSSPLNALSMSIGDTTVRRSALTMVCTFMLIMLLTLAFTGSSFASGMAILLRGTHGSGVYAGKYPVGLVQTFPGSETAPSEASQVKQVSLLTVQQQLHFPVYWPGYSLPGYALQHVNFYVDIDQQWADGPLLEFEYNHLPSVSPFADPRSGIWVREFKPRTNVLQLVGEDAAYPIEEDASGWVRAIYVNGQWDTNVSNGPVWRYDGRRELIYQIDGVVFWIAANQATGVGEQDLMQIAQSLTQCCVMQHVTIADETTPVLQRSDDRHNPFTNDQIVVPTNGLDGEGPYYFSVSSSQLPKNAY